MTLEKNETESWGGHRGQVLDKIRKEMLPSHP